VVFDGQFPGGAAFII